MSPWLLTVVNLEDWRTPSRLPWVVRLGCYEDGTPAHRLGNGRGHSLVCEEIEAYTADLLADQFLWTKLRELWIESGEGLKALACWCHPSPCCCHVLARMLNDWPTFAAAHRGHPATYAERGCIRGRV